MFCLIVQHMAYVQIGLIFFSTFHCHLHGPMFDYSRKFLSWNILLYALLFDILRPTLLFYYVNSKLLCLNPGVLEWERISLLSFYLDYVVVAYQIDRSNWPESCILCTFVSICVSGVIVMVTDCFSFICL